MLGDNGGAVQFGCRDRVERGPSKDHCSRSCLITTIGSLSKLRKKRSSSSVCWATKQETPRPFISRGQTTYFQSVLSTAPPLSYHPKCCNTCGVDDLPDLFLWPLRPAMPLEKSRLHLCSCRSQRRASRERPWRQTRSPRERQRCRSRQEPCWKKLFWAPRAVRWYGCTRRRRLGGRDGTWAARTALRTRFGGCGTWGRGERNDVSTFLERRHTAARTTGRGSPYTPPRVCFAS